MRKGVKTVTAEITIGKMDIQEATARWQNNYFLYVYFFPFFPPFFGFLLFLVLFLILR